MVADFGACGVVLGAAAVVVAGRAGVILRPVPEVVVDGAAKGSAWCM